MSGATIGGIVGGIVGFFFGVPQLGWMVGSLIGGAIDPDVIKGPRIGDGPAQSSAEGVPLPWVVKGVSPPIQGNICAQSERREVEKEDDGKGGPVQVTYEAHQDYCIQVCESSQIRGSTVKGPLIIWMQERIVYDMRPERNFAADNAKFMEKHRFYFGNQDQGPDPTLEAIYGVGNTPHHRGSFTCVAVDINLNQFGGAMPIYKWVMVADGDADTETTTSYVPPTYGRFVNSDWPLADPESSYTFIGIRTPITGAAVAFSADTIAEIIQHFADDPLTAYGGVPDKYVGYSAASPPAGTPGNPSSHGINRSVPQLDIVDNYSIVLVYQNTDPIEYINTNVNSGTSCALVPLQSNTDQFYASHDGTSFGKFARSGGGSGPGPAGLYDFTDCAPGNILSGMYGLHISVFRRRAPPVNVSGDPCLLGHPTALPDVPGFVIDCEGIVTPAPVYTEIDSLSMRGLQVEATNTVGLRTIFTQYTVGPIIPNSSPDNNQAFWEAEYAKAVAAGKMASGKVWPTDYPAITQHVYKADITVDSLTANAGLLADAITEICGRGGLPSSKIDVSEVDQVLYGYAICDSYNAADSLRPLNDAFSMFSSEHDGKLFFHKHGADVDMVIDPGEIIFKEDDDSDEEQREQAKEYPRSLIYSHVDPTQDYAVRTHRAQRVTPDVRAIGEESIQSSVIMMPDFGAKNADICLKRAWARVEGSRKFSLPFAGQTEVYLRAVPGKPIGLEGKRYIAGGITTEDYEISFEALRDRQSAFTSVVTAIPALPPTPTPTGIGGVTLISIMNLPALRDEDDRLGLYFAVAGLLPGWPGCLLQISRDDGASWQTAIASMTQASPIGYLTASLADAYEYGDDVTNTLSVAVHGGQLDSITQTQYLNEANPCAIVLPNGQAEIIQFRDADEITPDNYNLTHLARGRLGTTTAEHPAGTRFCSLDGVYFLELLGADIGRTLLFRPVTFNTAPENNATYSIVFNPAISQTEYPPSFLTHEMVGSTLELAVVPRYRFGTDENPINSANMIGFHWDATDGVNTAHSETSSPETSIDVTGWGSPITVEVSQVNRITGAGPALVKII